MTIAGEGKNPTQAHMLKLANLADISRPDANAILAEVQSAVGPLACPSRQDGHS